MSTQSKPIDLSRLNDLTLGIFGKVQPSETLDHLLRYLSTWSGSDKFFMVIQYAVKLIVPFLRWRARLQHRIGIRRDPACCFADGWAKLGDVVADARMLWRMWGLLPIFQWLIDLERSPPPNRTLLTLERLQGWSMLAYYPLEHLYYLASHDIIPSSLPTLSSLLLSNGKRIKLNLTKIGLWSCRFWAFYVILQIYHLREDRKLLMQRERSLRKAKGTSASLVDEKEELQKRWEAYWNEVIVNIGYLPLTVHWSLKRGLFKNDVWVGVFGLIAAISSFRGGWNATALPSGPPPPTLEEFSMRTPPPPDSAASSSS